MTKPMTSPNPARPLDLSNLLKHAFLAGTGCVAPECDTPDWVDYDPNECPAYQRIAAMLSAAKPPADAVAEQDAFYQGWLARWRDRLASLSPAAMSGSEAGGGPTYVVNCCNCGRIIDTREEDAGGDGWGHELSDERWVCSPECLDAVSGKPASSPAGGDVDGTTQIALGHFKTTTERAQRITVLEETLRVARQAIWSGGETVKAISVIDAALSQPTSAAEPVAEDEAAVESAAIRIIRNRASDGPSADRAVAHARQFDTYVWRDAKRDARAALSCSTPPAPAAVDGQRALRIALFDLVEWIEMEVDLSLRPGLRKRVADAKALCERPRACLATDKEGA